MINKSLVMLKLLLYFALQLLLVLRLLAYFGMYHNNRQKTKEISNNIAKVTSHEKPRVHKCNIHTSIFIIQSKATKVLPSETAIPGTYFFF